MPELPEVEVVCQGLAPHLPGRVITGSRASGLRLRLPLPLAAINERVCGQMVSRVFRRAKFVVVAVGEAWLVIHLGMTGRLGIFPGDAPAAKHDHLCLSLDNGMELRFNDARRFGSVQLFSPAEGERYFAAMGMEPFSDAFCAPALKKRAARRVQPVKNFLMDNRVVVGIGNIYANEALHRAGVSPLRPVCRVTDREWHQIVESARKVLARAIEAGGSTIADFVGSSGEKGYFQLQLAVYGRAGSECQGCGAAIVKTVVGGRATFFCPGCQA